MKQRIRVATIITNENKVLLVKHVHPETGYTWWVPPGGGLEEKDSSIFECAKREAFEETNLTVESSRIIYLREFLDKENNQLNIEIFLLADSYDGSIDMKNIKGSGPDDKYIKQVRWLSKEEIQDVTVFPEILMDSFWQDHKQGFPSTRYLGRQV